MSYRPPEIKLYVEETHNQDGDWVYRITEDGQEMSGGYAATEEEAFAEAQEEMRILYPKPEDIDRMAAESRCPWDEEPPVRHDDSYDDHIYTSPF